MEFFKIKRDIPFMRHALILNAISVLTFVAAVFFLFHKGLNFSVEFTGGTVMELHYPHPADQEKIRTTLRGMGYSHPEVASFGTAQDIMLRLPIVQGTPAASASGAVFNAICASESGTPKVTQVTTAKGEIVNRSSCVAAGDKELLSLQRVEFVGPSVGDELQQNGLNALIMVVVGVVIYLAIRFEWKFAVAAIVANLHDVVIILGFFAFFQWEFSLTVLAAILAVLGYSVNESVVIFDRIREMFRKQRKMTVPRDRPCDHQHHLAYHHHPRFDPDDGAVDAVLRRLCAALLRDRADHRHLLRHLFVGVRGGGDGDVAGRQARRPDQAGQGEGRDRRRRGVSDAGFPPLNMPPRSCRGGIFVGKKRICNRRSRFKQVVCGNVQRARRAAPIVEPSLSGHP
jgi:preprotein translocase subunit SecF